MDINNLKEISEKWECVSCHKVNPFPATTCLFCENHRSHDFLWQCPNCEHINPDYFPSCNLCALPFQEKYKWEAGKMALSISISGASSVSRILWRGETLGGRAEALGSMAELSKFLDDGFVKRYFKKWRFLDAPETLPAVIIGKYLSLPRKRRSDLTGRVGVVTAAALMFFLSNSSFFAVGGVLLGLYWLIQNKSHKLERYAIKGVTPLLSTSALRVSSLAPISDISFSKSENELVSVDLKGGICRYDLATGKSAEVYSLTNTNLDQVAINHNGGLLLKGKTLEVFNSNGNIVQKVSVSKSFNRSAKTVISYKLDRIAVPGTQGLIYLFEKGLTSTYHSHTLSDQMPGMITSLMFIDSGRKLISGNALGGVNVWDLKKKEPVFYFLNKYFKVSHLSFSPALMLWATSYISGEIFIFSILSFEKKSVLKTFGDAETPASGEEAPYLIFSDFIPGSSNLLGIDQRNEVRIWDLKSKEEMPIMQWKLPSGKWTTFKVSGDGNQLALGSEMGNIIFMDIRI